MAKTTPTLPIYELLTEPDSPFPRLRDPNGHEIEFLRAISFQQEAGELPLLTLTVAANLYSYRVPAPIPPVPLEAVSDFLFQNAAATQALAEALAALHAAIDRFPPSTRPHLQVQITHPTPGKA